MALDADAARVLERAPLSGRPPFETVFPAPPPVLLLGRREILAPDPRADTDIVSSLLRGHGANRPIGKVICCHGPVLDDICGVEGGCRHG
jgi:hypothetical protein